MSRPKTTATQARIVEFMREFLAKEDRMPSTREIASHFDCWQGNVCQHLRRLTESGVIEHRAGDGRKGWWRFSRQAETEPT